MKVSHAITSSLSTERSISMRRLQQPRAAAALVTAIGDVFHPLNKITDENLISNQFCTEHTRANIYIYTHCTQLKKLELIYKLTTNKDRPELCLAYTLFPPNYNVINFSFIKSAMSLLAFPMSLLDLTFNIGNIIYTNIIIH